MAMATTALMLLVVACLLASGMAAVDHQMGGPLLPSDPCDPPQCSLLPREVQAKCNEVAREINEHAANDSAAKPAYYRGEGYDGGYGGTEHDDGYYHHDGYYNDGAPRANTACHHHGHDRDYTYLPSSRVSFWPVFSLQIVSNGAGGINPGDEKYNFYQWGYFGGSILPATNNDKKPGDWSWRFSGVGYFTPANDRQRSVRVTKGTEAAPEEVTVRGLWGAPNPKNLPPELEGAPYYRFRMYSYGATDPDVCISINSTSLVLPGSCAYYHRSAPGVNDVERTDGSIVLDASYLTPFLGRSMSVSEFELINQDPHALPWRNHPVTWKCVFPKI